MKRVSFDVDGETLRGELHEPAGSRRRNVPLVVLAHGLSSSRKEWFDFPQKIAEGGYAVFSFDFRGHGESGGDRGVQSVARATRDLLGAIEAARREPWVDQGRVAVLAHSLGAALTICAAPGLPLTCLIALAPPRRIRDETGALEFAGYTLSHWINKGVRLLYRRGMAVPYKVDYRRLYVDPEAIERGRREQFLQRWIPLRNYPTLVHELKTDACARHVRVPTLVMTAEFDQVVRSARRVFEALPEPKKHVEVKKSGHSMAGDAQSGFVATVCREFLDENLKGAPT